METSLQPRISQSRNLGQTERILSLLTGLGMASYVLLRRPRGGLPVALSAGYMTYRGATGHCLAYQALGISRAAEDGREGIHVERSVTVNRPRSELYRIWRNFENLPRFMKHLESVRAYDADGHIRYHWAAKGPLDRQVAWDSEVTEDRENELLAWRSLTGSIVESTGRVEFADAPGGRGTVLHVAMQYLPPGGSAGAAFARLFGEDPSIQVREDLRAFKQIMEAGETATIEGQPSGRVSFNGKAGTKPRPRKDRVEEASAESFPASDPPGWISKE